MILGDGTPDADQPEGILRGPDPDMVREYGYAKHRWMLKQMGMYKPPNVLERLLIAAQAVKDEQAEQDAMFPPNKSGDGAGWCPEYRVSEDAEGWL